jgi:hypothetical protein
MTMPLTQRQIILDALRSRIEKQWGFSAGVKKQVFRHVFRRQWMPGNKVRPAAWVVDAGAAKLDGGSDESKSKKLTAQIILDIEGNFEQQEDSDLWTSLVESISLDLQNFNPRCGCTSCDVVNDDPFEVLIAAGQSEQIWKLDLEITYTVDVTAFADNA